MNFTLNVWRQNTPKDAGRMETYQAKDISPDTSFLEMLDLVNEDLIRQSKEPIAFDHDCREGICGACSMVINGVPHGPERGATTCQLHMRRYKDGDVISVEPWRAAAFPVIRDLVTDRTSMDRIIAAGGYISVNTGGTPDGNEILISKETQETAMDAAQCIQCGACVAACKNASAMLFVAAKVGHLGQLPQGQAERNQRVLKMVEQHDKEGFGHCTNTYECEAVCPKEISVGFIAQLNRDYFRTALQGESRK